MRRTTFLQFLPRLLVLVAGLAPWSAAPLAAQEPDTLRDPRARPEQGELTAVQDTAPLETPAPAYVPPRYSVSVTIGRPGGGVMQVQPVQLTTLDEAGLPVDSAVLRRSVEAGDGVQLGVSAVYGLGPAWGVRVGASVGRISLRPHYDGDEATLEDAAPALAADEGADVSTFIVEGALRMRLLSSRRAQPYLEIGASWLRWSTDPGAGAAVDLPGGEHRLGAVGGAGVLIPFTDRLSARVQVQTRAFRTPVAPRAAGSEALSSATHVVTFAPPSTGLFADGIRELYSTTRLEVGITVRLQ